MVMNKKNNTIELIRTRRVKFQNNLNSSTHKRIQQLRKEIVKVSFQKTPNLELHRFLMQQLKEANEELIQRAS
jgi:hypothetical protein